MKVAAGIVVLAACIVAAHPSAESQRLPTPEASFGFQPGADYKLATYDQSIEYFRKLDAASKYLTLIEAGRTSQGRPMYFALISTPANLAHIDRYREIALRLAHPSGLSEAEARRLAAEGKALVHIDGGLHATEVAGPQHTPLLAYDLLARASERDWKSILENVVLMLWPTINPDGQQMVAEWYMKNVGTPYEQSAPPLLYQEYVGHDNNRDAYMLNMIESRVMEHAWRQWEPQIIYVHHQSGPFPTRIWLPPFSEPVGKDAPPLIAREVNMIGMAIAKGLEERGQVGATHMGTAFDAWYPGYIDYAPNFKNIAAFWTETALYQYATPHEYTIQDFPQNMRDLRPRSLYSSPWPPGWWRLRDAVSYMETASLSVLEYAAKYKDSLLLNRYRAGREQIARGRTQSPYAYVIPQDQRDVIAAVELLRRLAFGGVRISQLTAAARFDDTMYPGGTWIIRTDQEYAALAREVLDIQKYPDLRQSPGGPPERPYDAAGWTLPLQMDVRVIPVAQPLSDDTVGRLVAIGPGVSFKSSPTRYVNGETDAAAFDSVPGAGFNSDPAASAIVPPPGRIAGTGSALAVDPAANNAFRAINRAWKEGAGVQFRAANGSRQPRYIVTGLPADRQTDLVRALALVAERTDEAGVTVRKPRIGVFEPWGGSMAAGWTRWLLDQYGFEYITLRAGGLSFTALVPNRRAGDAGRNTPARRCGHRRPRRAHRQAGVRRRYDAGRSRRDRSICTERWNVRLCQYLLRIPDSAVQAARHQQRQWSTTGGILPPRLDRRSRDRHGTSDHGRNAGDGGVVRRRGASLRDTSRLCGVDTRQIYDPRLPAAVWLLDRRQISFREERGTGRAARIRTRRPAGVSPGVARPAIRDVSSIV